MKASAKQDTAESIAQELELIVGASGICNRENFKPVWQDRLREVNTPENLPSIIVSPKTAEELAQVMTQSHRKNWRVLPCGSGSKLSWGGIGKEVDLLVSTERLNRVIEHAVGDLTVTVEAGVKFSDLQEILLKTNQFLPLEPAYPQDATIGGMIATADSGSLRQRYGGVRDMLLGISLVRSDGQIAKAGGRVVKNVAGYDLMKLFTGSYGTLGILTEVTLRLYPLTQASASVVLTGDMEAISSATKTLLASSLTPTAIDLLSNKLVTQMHLGQGMGLIVRFQSITEAVKEQSARLLEVGQKLGLQGNLSENVEESHLWQLLPEQIWKVPQKPGIVCKIGVLPNAAVSTLNHLETLTSSTGLGLIHAGSGLGLLRFDAEKVTAKIIGEMRSYCNSQKGFLTVLEAPIALKQKLDVWGYNGNALNIMRQIKQQFDPTNILSPNRFVGEI